MRNAPGGPESDESRAEAGRLAVLHDRRRPGRREVAPELIPLLRGQGPKMVEAPGDAADALPLWDDLSSVSGIMRGLGIASLGWMVAGFLVLR